ncbi:TPA: hypothetical protein OF435_000798 [Escherichia coli]|uniref:hypothetical protein n=1 Tax=Escherichia coli TaxID=562 RepID=UPI00228EAF0A|nr:hypothetical protein [Escherichia coli]EIW6182481.1 hypothetical protein [Escherichia coli]EMC5103909.1 hypothetical protein [Escherichia coli]HCP8225277.1 hypothetical protein [Escherichia coli]HCX5617881.1 hypothetical protein [Escherichia coli]
MTIHIVAIQPDYFQPVLKRERRAVLLNEGDYIKEDFLFIREFIFDDTGKNPPTATGACVAGVITDVYKTWTGYVLLSFDLLFVYSYVLINWGLTRGDLLKLSIYPDFLEELFTAHPHSPVFYAIAYRMIEEADL